MALVALIRSMTSVRRNFIRFQQMSLSVPGMLRGSKLSAGSKLPPLPLLGIYAVELSYGESWIIKSIPFFALIIIYDDVGLHYISPSCSNFQQGVSMHLEIIISPSRLSRHFITVK